jgi:hypothetical protein
MILAVRRNFLLFSSYVALHFAKELYSRIQYAGLLLVGIRMKGIWGRMLCSELDEHSYDTIGQTLDNEFCLERKISTTEFTGTFETFAVEILGELMWNCGMGVRALEKVLVADMLGEAKQLIQMNFLGRR